MSSKITWNNQLKLIISDVDETVADLYMRAEPKMIQALTDLLADGRAIFFVTGQGLKSVQWRIIDHIQPQFRSRILVGHCSGAEVWGYNTDGTLRSEPFYSSYNLKQEQGKLWRELVQLLIAEFKLETYPPIPILEFLQQAGNNPLAIMFEDRGPQITFEVVNGYDLTPKQVRQLETTIPKSQGSYDFRIPILERADQLFLQARLPITARLAGTFAIDFAIKGISKTTIVKHVLENKDILAFLDVNKKDLENPKSLEVWGDKFSILRGGTDRHMSEALSKEVRSIDFREENATEFLEGYNTVVWDGDKHLHHGLLEFLQSRYS